MNKTMRTLKPFLMTVLVAVSCVAGTSAQTPPQPEQQKQYVPLADAPPQEQIPSARLVIAAYSFVVLALFAYLLSLSKRLTAVKSEIARLEGETKRSHRT
jgi:CcmD family protein